MPKNRNYSCKDVDMLMASKTIAQNFKAKISELSTIRTDWTEQYADELIARIDNSIINYLGIDPKKDLRNATSVLKSIQVPAKRDISYFKTQIDEDFKKEISERDEILKTLGFVKYLKGVQKGNQESLIQLLYQFKKNMTDTFLQEITAKGMNATLIHRIIGYADTFNQANVIQETFKGSTKEISREVAGIFDAIYDEIISICKKASNYYQYESLKKEQFTFAKVLSNLGTVSKLARIEET